jgi:hypothetical protein
MWHRKLWLIDHGAALYFHHQWDGFMERSRAPFAMVKDHVLIRFASRIEEVDADMARRLTPDVVAAIVDLIPDDWLEDDGTFRSKGEQRDAYRRYFTSRLEAPRAFVEEAVRARSVHL